MKRVLTAALALLTMLSLTAVAYADVIFSPVELAGYYVLRFLPWGLVIILAVVTICLLKKFWKNKK